MFGIDLIYLGNEKDKHYNMAADEYIKRLGAFCAFSSRNLKDERLSDNPSDAEIASALEKEGKQILQNVPERSYKIAMCIEGKQLSSEELAAALSSLADKGYSRATFIIGSSCGLSESVKAQCDLRLSMSRMTFPHKLAKVMLLEQIYRAFCINKGSKYHK